MVAQHQAAEPLTSSRYIAMWESAVRARENRASIDTTRGGADPRPHVGVVERACEGARESGCVGRLDEDAVDPVGNHRVGDAAKPRDDARQSGRHRFQHDVRQPLAGRREDQDVGGAIVALDVVRLFDQCNAGGDLQPIGIAADAFGQRGVDRRTASGCVR